MECNVGGSDRTMRAVAGAGLLGAALFVPMDRTLKTLAWIGAGIGLGTALTRYCPANRALGVDTCHSPV